MSEQRPAPRSGGRRRILAVLWILVVSIGLLEIAARVLTGEMRGVPAIQGTPLVPLPRPTPAQVAELARPLEALRYIVPDPDLGWTIRPSADSGDGLYLSDALGRRTGPNRPSIEAAQRTLWICGDSLAHGDEVAYEDSWGARLEHLSNGATRVENLAVPGYATDQAILRFERHLKRGERPDVAILTLYRRNILRAATFARPFQYPLSGIPYMKPRLVLEPDGSLVLFGTPVPRPGAQAEVMRRFEERIEAAFDRIFHPPLYEEAPLPGRLARWITSMRRMARFEQGQEAFVSEGGQGVALAVALVNRFVERCEREDIEARLVFLGDSDDLVATAAGRPLHAALERAVRERHPLLLDTLDGLAGSLQEGEDPRDLYVNRRGHPDAEGCRRIALLVHDFLISR